MPKLRGIKDKPVVKGSAPKTINMNTGITKSTPPIVKFIINRVIFPKVKERSLKRVISSIGDLPSLILLFWFK